jgi:RNA polymerase sigma factor (sigma-70 family)
MSRDVVVQIKELLEQFYAADNAMVETILNELVEQVRPVVRGFFIRQGIDHNDAEDLLQLTLLRLTKKLRHSRRSPDQRVEYCIAYAEKTALNVFVDHLRICRRQSQLTVSLEELAATDESDMEALLPPDPADVEATVTAMVSDEQLRPELWKVIREKLPPLQRAALLLHVERHELLLLAGTRSEAAEALDVIPAEEFAAIWRALPLSDREIAERLKIAPSPTLTGVGKVSNLRKSARDLMARWLAKWLEA